MSSFRLSLFSLAVAVCLAAPSGLAPARGEAPPDIIAETIAEAAKICRTAGGKSVTDSVLRSDDLNGDSNDDWIIDFAKLRCEGADNPACNASGCTLQLYFWAEDGAWELVFEDFAKSYKFSSSGDTRTMHVTTSGIPCNKPVDESCAYNYRLDKDAVIPVQ